MAQRTFVAEHVVAATPWDVFELLTDDEQQDQWRARFERRSPVAAQEPYTRVTFEDGLVLELEPSGPGTLVRGTRTRVAQGPLGVIGLWVTSRGTAESELEALLKRIGATLEFGGI